MPLFSVSDFDNLPVEPQARWLAIRDLAKVHLKETFCFSDNADDFTLLEYVQVLLTAGAELAVSFLKILLRGIFVASSITSGFASRRLPLN